MATFTVTPRLESRLLKGLEALGEDVARIHESVLKLSDFYLERPAAPTPWDMPYALPATLAYFMPLNFARGMAVFRELERFVPSDAIREIWDFGSGLGTTHWVLEEQDWLTPRALRHIEISRRAAAFHDDLAAMAPARWKSLGQTAARPGSGALAVFSYSFLEMPGVDVSAFDHLLILEPSTRERGRALMAKRAELLAAGYEALAPCTHAGDCPLLVHSPRDWCHQRIHFEAPEWWLEMESHLPMRNRTLTFSYLLLSRAVRDQKWRGATRVIGDTLAEKGKTRQMVCRGPEREFFTWLHKLGEPPHIPHGALVADLGVFEKKSDELRVSPAVSWAE
ncbi:MAG TPA: small ribosomal subunit Rsm22 family protein [Bdellovibrionales bacterium]|nr:small ribosomal subunit Rsm22 family protein [Bdellovibrionales bacterium]